MPTRRRSYHRSRPTGPVVMTSRYPGKCHESGEPFRVGDPILWDPRGRVCYRLESAAYAAFLDSQPAEPDRFDMMAEDDGARSIGML